VGAALRLGLYTGVCLAYTQGYTCVYPVGYACVFAFAPMYSCDSDAASCISVAFIFLYSKKSYLCMRADPAVAANGLKNGFIEI
jgi:hypothetical protein